MWIDLDRSNHIPIIRQLYNALQNMILQGELKPKDKLPSTRELATTLHISRNIVLETYEQLESEGFLYTIPQSGTYVSEGASLNQITREHKVIRQVSAKSKEGDVGIDLRSGIPDVSKLPMKKWNSYRNAAALDMDHKFLGYTDFQGQLSLRMAICNYVKRMRGLNCDPEQIVITSGSMYSFHILASVLSNHSALPYLVEDPIHTEIRNVFLQVNPNIHPIPVDWNGICTNHLPADIHPIFCYVTPSHQYPTGGCLSIQRRLELLKYADKMNMFMIEDDYDSEFRYNGTPVKALYSLKPDRVIYVESFSKIFFPSVRLGYMILPPQLVEPVVHQMRYTTYFIDTLTQLAMTRFLEEHLLDRYLVRMKKHYLQKRNLMIRTCHEVLGSKVNIHGKDIGLHIVLEVPEVWFDDDMIMKCRRLGLKIYPVWKFASREDYPKNQLIIGYSHLTEDEIHQAVQILSKIISE